MVTRLRHKCYFFSNHQVNINIYYFAHNKCNFSKKNLKRKLQYYEQCIIIFVSNRFGNITKFH